MNKNETIVHSSWRCYYWLSFPTFLSLYLLPFSLPGLPRGFWGPRANTKSGTHNIDCWRGSGGMPPENWGFTCSKCVAGGSWGSFLCMNTVHTYLQVAVFVYAARTETSMHLRSYCAVHYYIAGVPFIWNDFIPQKRVVQSVVLFDLKPLVFEQVQHCFGLPLHCRMHPMMLKEHHETRTLLI